MKMIRLLSKQRYFEEFIGAYEAQDRSVHVVHEDPSTEATQKLPKERMFRKKSIVFLAPLLLTACDPVSWIVGGTAIVGTTAVRNRAGVRGSISDSELYLKIQRKLFDAHRDYSNNVELGVKHGMVVVIGHLANDKQCTEVMDIVRSVDGYNEVFDETSVQNYPGPKDFAIDTSITSRIKSALAFDSNVLSLNYDVTTVNGVVYLCGTASSTFERDVVINHARSTSGVKNVVVYIRIEHGEHGPKSATETKKEQKISVISSSSAPATSRQ